MKTRAVYDAVAEVEEIFYNKDLGRRRIPFATAVTSTQIGPIHRGRKGIDEMDPLDANQKVKICALVTCRHSVVGGKELHVNNIGMS